MSGKTENMEHRSRKDYGEMEDDGGAWMNEGANCKVAEFLTWFTSEPEAEVPLKNIVMISSSRTGGPDKNTLRMVSKQCKDDAEEGTRSIKWKGPGKNVEYKKLTKPGSLTSILSGFKNGRFKPEGRLPNLKRINCSGLDTLMDLNGCPSGLEELKCYGCRLIQSLAPLATCTNLRKLDLFNTNVSNLKPLQMGCVMLEWLHIGNTPVSDLRPLSVCINLKALWMTGTQVSDLSPLSGLHQLRMISINSTRVTGLSPLSNLSNLETLMCGNTEISDLTPLSKCLELKALNIKDTEVKSLNPLLQCKKLKYLNHSNLKDCNKKQTETCVECIKEMCPGLQCSELAAIAWWVKLPLDRIHGSRIPDFNYQ